MRPSRIGVDPLPGEALRASLGDGDEVVQPAVAFVIGLEPADKVLPSRRIAVKDRSPAKLEEDQRAILSGD
jgi:hypothetical protein